MPWSRSFGSRVNNLELPVDSRPSQPMTAHDCRLCGTAVAIDPCSAGRLLTWTGIAGAPQRSLGSPADNLDAPDLFPRSLSDCWDVNGVVLLADPTVIERGRRIAELAQAARLPTAFQRRECRMERT